MSGGGLIHSGGQILHALRGELLTPARLERFRRRLTAGGAAREAARAAETAAVRKRLTAAERCVANILTAIKAGILTASTKQELVAAEEEVTAARGALERGPAENVVKVLPRAVASYETMVAALPGMLNKDPDRAREILRRLLGVVKIVPEKSGLYAEISTSPGQLLDLAGFNGSGGRI